MATDEATHVIGVKELAIKSLQPNPHNPRMLFDRADMDILKSSIERVGILVPLTVYKESRTGIYRILDGQRRWMCAQEAGLDKVPVNEVSEPSLVQNIVTMFQIHKLRKDWELMPTALKLELLMREGHLGRRWRRCRVGIWMRNKGEVNGGLRVFPGVQEKAPMQ